MKHIDEHPLRYSSLVDKIERVIQTRLHHNRLDGYVLETAIQIADSIVGVPTDAAYITTTAKEPG